MYTSCYMEVLLTCLSNSDITNIISLVGFLLTFISIIFVIVNIRAIIAQNKISIKIGRNQRFQTAITQLVKDKDAVVLGAIYTLHTIAKEDKNYIEMVFNIFCSYVRDTTSSKDYKQRHLIKPSEPILAIIKLICTDKDEFKVYRNPSKKIKKYSNNRKINDFIIKYIIKPKKKLILDFSGAYLRGVEFENNIFEFDIFNGVDFTNSIFQNCYFWACYFDKSIFVQTKILDTQFIACNMESSDFRGSYIFASTFDSYLTDSIFIGSYFEGNTFNGSINFTNFTASYLRRTEISEDGSHIEFAGAFSSQATYKDNNLRSFESRINFRIDKLPELDSIYNNKNVIYSNTTYTKEHAEKLIIDYKKHLGKEN